MKPLGPHRARDYIWERARGYWMEGKSAHEIGRLIGVTQQAVSYQARARKWPQRKQVIIIVSSEDEDTGDTEEMR